MKQGLSAGLNAGLNYSAGGGGGGGLEDVTGLTAQWRTFDTVDRVDEDIADVTYTRGALIENGAPLVARTSYTASAYTVPMYGHNTTNGAGFGDRVSRSFHSSGVIDHSIAFFIRNNDLTQDGDTVLQLTNSSDNTYATRVATYNDGTIKLIAGSWNGSDFPVFAVDVFGGVNFASNGDVVHVGVAYDASVGTNGTFYGYIDGVLQGSTEPTRALASVANSYMIVGGRNASNVGSAPHCDFGHVMEATNTVWTEGQFATLATGWYSGAP